MPRATKRRTALLAGLPFLALVFLLLLAITLPRDPTASAPLTVWIEGYTKDSNGGRVAMLGITNHSKQTILYAIYSPQQFGSNGWPQELPIMSGGILNELAPRSSTNQLVRVSDARFRQRIPIHFHSPPTRLDRTGERIRSAISARSLKPLLQQQHSYTVAHSPESIVFSNELDVADADDLLGVKTQE